ncbi:translation initiation factor IF-2-like [Elephas maximus indicus]|uniref:translation initiation factor IF-2-like n=1 Tax=Elephas maximus indicus TaxID=99487 RepID=UPI00211686C2|nr:translation initiation factor IF-2-like [Elephas maximus indicus]
MRRPSAALPQSAGPGLPRAGGARPAPPARQPARRGARPAPPQASSRPHARHCAESGVLALWRPGVRGDLSPYSSQLGRSCRESTRLLASAGAPARAPQAPGSRVPLAPLGRPLVRKTLPMYHRRNRGSDLFKATQLVMVEMRFGQGPQPPGAHLTPQSLTH